MGSHPSSEALQSSIATAQLCLNSAINDSGHAAPCSRADLLSRFDGVFSEASAIERHDLEQAFRLRYQVYCLDRGFEDASTCPEQMERDSYDAYAFHTLLRNRTNQQVLGTVRLVRPGASPSWVMRLPLAEYADIDSIDELKHLPAGSTAEVSRFAIARSARNSLNCLADAVSTAAEEADPNWRQRLLPYMSLGLIRGLVRMSREHDITHWCLAAEPSLLRRLRSFGLYFKDAGPLVEHRGMRQICYANLERLLERAEAEQPECWEIMTDRGELATVGAARNAA